MYFKNIYLSKYEIVSRQNLRSLNKYFITYDTDSNWTFFETKFGQIPNTVK